MIFGDRGTNWEGEIDRSTNQYRSEICLNDGNISPLAFPDVSLDSLRLFC
ncbi:hypothetical protein [Chamaesiphon sp.]